MPNEANSYLLSYLRKFVAEHGYAPTVREVQEWYGYKSPDTAQRRLRSLVDAGLIRRAGPRAIEFLDV
jgi:repressor LexA